MRDGAARLAGQCLGAAAAVGAPAAANAQQLQSGVIVSTGVSAETNPFNSATADGVYAAATAQIRPRITIRDARSVIDIEGSAQLRQFARDYGLEDNYSVNGTLLSRRSDRLTLRSGVSVVSAESGNGRLGRPSSSATAIAGPLAGSGTAPGGGTAVDPGINAGAIGALQDDPALFGIRARSTSFAGSVGANVVLSSRDEVSVDARVEGLRVLSSRLADFNSVTGEAQYNRTLSERTSVGLIGSIGRTDYLRFVTGDATFYSALVSVNQRLNARWTVSAAAGGSLTKARQLPGLPDENLTAFNVRGSFCRINDLTRFCLKVARSPQPSAAGAVRITDTLGITGSIRLSERQSASVDGNYSRTANSSRFGNVGGLSGFRIYGVATRYDNQLTDRASLFTSASFSKVDDKFQPRRANFGLSLGIQYRLGALR